MSNEFTPPTVFSRTHSEFASFADTGVALEELPVPTLWRVLVLPLQPKQMSSGGIVLAKAATDAERILQYIGQILALGPLAGKSDKFLNPDWSAEKYDVPRWYWDFKVGDWVTYGRYAGMGMSYKGVSFLAVNDDEIITKIPTPDGYKVYI